MLDNVMPKLSGWEVTKILKTNEEYREFADVPIIMFSAMDDVKDKVEGLELGADDYITKPFNFSEVLARIRAILRTRELVGQIERREARLDITEKMNEEVLSFARGLRGPLESIATEAKALSPADAKTKAFVDRCAREAAEELTKLDAVSAAVSSLRNEAESLKKSETALPALKRRLRP
jgi:DNA-binding response OmpR family regulator